MKEQDDQNAEKLFMNLMKDMGWNNYDLTRQQGGLHEFYSLEKDLQFMFDDKRRFTRSEAIRAIVIKIQILKEINLIIDYFKSILKHQGEQFHLIDPEKPEESLVEFFCDLIDVFLPVGVPPEAESFTRTWKGKIDTIFFEIKKSVQNLKCGFDLHDTYEGADRVAGELLTLIKKEEPDRFVDYKEIKETLKVKKNDTFKQYFDQLGITLLGSSQKPLITESDFNKLKEFWKSRQ
jgi:hypothetical protein